MKFDVKACVNRILQILLVALLSFSLDYLIIRLTSDDSIWLGPSIEVVGSVLFSPVVGAVATLINRLIIDYLLYGVIDYSFVTLLEIGSVTLIGIIYRKLCPKGSRFGVREIVIFNFVQLLINACVLFLSTPPLAITLFAGLIDDWSKAQMLEEMAAHKDDVALCMCYENEEQHTPSERGLSDTACLIHQLFLFAFGFGVLRIKHLADVDVQPTVDFGKAVAENTETDGI